MPACRACETDKPAAAVDVITVVVVGFVGGALVVGFMVRPVVLAVVVMAAVLAVAVVGG